MSNSVIKDKSFAFAVRVVNLYKHIIEVKKEFVLSKQLLRSGTSIGANVREALNAESKADFIHKLAISQKEADETCYWLELLKETKYITESEFSSIHTDAIELLKIIRSIIITTKQNLKK
ncbi:MAG: four helix bundle protein [Bacteroidales bacterium]|jgi:four helix bundle protein|nr:four helix bundle protein [Bacteroidales bacterium]